MSDSEMTGFEEHFLACSDCLEELRNSVQLSEFIKSEGYHLFPEFQDAHEKKEAKVSGPEQNIFFRSLVTPRRLALGLGTVVILLFLFVLYEPDNEFVTNEEITYNENEVFTPVDTTEENIVNDEVISEDSLMEMYAANFEESESLEFLMDQSYTSSDDLLIISPLKGEVVYEEVWFEWNYKPEEQLILHILDNRENVIFKFTLRDSELAFNLADNELEPGLYYWKLESEDDMLYLRKFLFKGM